MAFRARQPLPRYCGCRLSHAEFITNEDGETAQTIVDDCKELPPVEDFDLELAQKSGENLREVSTTIINHGRINFKEKPVEIDEPDISEQNNNDKE